VNRVVARGARGLRAVVAGGGPASRCVGRPARPGGRRSGRGPG